MSTDLDYDFTLDQWNALKALRLPAAERRALNRSVVETLIALELAAVTDDGPSITARGRSVMLRGSPLLLDLAS
jgi:hypothetical protein